MLFQWPKSVTDLHLFISNWSNYKICGFRQNKRLDISSLYCSPVPPAAPSAEPALQCPLSCGAVLWVTFCLVRASRLRHSCESPEIIGGTLALAHHVDGVTGTPRRCQKGANSNCHLRQPHCPLSPSLWPLSFVASAANRELTWLAPSLWCRLGNINKKVWCAFYRDFNVFWGGLTSVPSNAPAYATKLWLVLAFTI